jgi:3'-phosphoadenosine 5'-phosphosulfate sulfotransferase (PAPS reductase)/FAD synthetase
MGKFNWINVSGGKDSTALLLWSIDECLPNCRYVYADTMHEHEAVYEYLYYLEQKTGVSIERIKGEGFLELCKRKGRFPSVKARFCTEDLKVRPLAEYMDSQEENDGDNPHMVWVGIRREESPARSNLPEVMYSNFKYPPRITSYQLRHHPLLELYAQDVFDIHKKHGIEPNPLYKMGMHRVGCFPCILSRRAELKTLFKVCPQVIDRLRSWEDEVNLTSKEGIATFFAEDKYPRGTKGNIDVFVAALGEGEELPGLEQDVGGCMSVYGLCE